VFPSRHAGAPDEVTEVLPGDAGCLDLDFSHGRGRVAVGDRSVGARVGTCAHRETVAAVERGHGGVLVIQCTAGIGKSALLRAVCEQATDQGLRTLTARASELERDFGFRRGSRAAGGTDRPYRRARAR
jgi:hypothetical protein